jgi:hypothetical protein
MGHVAVHADMNLRPLRECGPEELEAAFQLRVDLHGWDAAVTPDGSAVRLQGGSVTLDLALGAALLHHLEEAATG